MNQWKTIALVTSGIAIGAIATRFSTPDSAHAAPPGAASQRCEWSTIVDGEKPIVSAPMWRSMTTEGYSLKVYTSSSYIFERCTEAPAPAPKGHGF